MLFRLANNYWSAFFIGAPGMARSALTALFLELWWRRDDLAVQVRYRPGKGNG